jgi:hypothetical protein
MFTYHKDHANGKWNVFFVQENSMQDFIRAFDSLEEAQKYCDVMNGRR